MFGRIAMASEFREYRLVEISRLAMSALYATGLFSLGFFVHHLIWSVPAPADRAFRKTAKKTDHEFCIAR